MLFFLPIWLAVWTAIGVLAARSLLHPDEWPFALFIAIWLVFWAAGWLWTVYVWLWNAFGKEVVTVGYGHLVVKMDILGFGRSKVFPVSEVSNLRASRMFGSSMQGSSGTSTSWGLGSEVIAFESGGKTHRFGMQLEEDEAQEVVAQLAERLPMPRPEPG